MITLEELFKKSGDSLQKSFDAEKFTADVDSLSKSETETLLGHIQAEILKGGDYDTLTEMRDIALGHIEKAIYADTPENRKLGRVGQQYGGKGSRGGKQDDDNAGLKKQRAKRNNFINSLKANGANKHDDHFIGKNEKYFSDVLKKHGFKDWDDFQDYGNSEDCDYEKYGRVYMQCAKAIPPEAFK